MKMANFKWFLTEEVNQAVCMVDYFLKIIFSDDMILEPGLVMIFAHGIE